MRLLIITQAVDLDDPVLGFFHSWIRELAKRSESVHVICLKEGRHSLPANVRVYSLGKESGVSRTKYIWRFFKYIWSLRNEYDSVFVHMNQEYVLMGGNLWWILGKRVVLWRNHKRGSIFTRIAGFLSFKVCFTSPSAYVAHFGNAVQMPIGIDTALFKPSGSANPNSILFLGRLDAVKKPEVFLQALDILAKQNIAFMADIIGDPTPGREEFARELRKRFSSVPGVAFKPSIRNDEAAAEYASHAIYVNLTPSGSFDKTIGEGMACGCIVVVGNEALRGAVPDELLVDVNSADSVARGIKSALLMDADRREALSRKSRAYVIETHSLALLAPRLHALFRETAQMNNMTIFLKKILVSILSLFPARFSALSIL
ncbi:MAG: glycosyltransferase family 4 protein, partial [Patescibacteria group bacterium]